MALVIKKWYASSTANAQGNYVHIVGREGGLIAWLLSVVGLDPSSEVEVKETIVIFTSASLSGRTTRVIPMKALTSAYYGYHKPWKMALAITILLSPFMLIGLVLGPLYYFLNKSLAVGLVEASGWTGVFAFRRSVIERQNINENEAYRVIEILRSLVERNSAGLASPGPVLSSGAEKALLSQAIVAVPETPSEARGGAERVSSTAPQVQPQSGASPRPETQAVARRKAFCGACGQPAREGLRFCDGCGAELRLS